MTRAYVGIGSNIEPERHVPMAIHRLREVFGPLVLSPVYACPAVGFDGPDFINLVAGLDVELDAHSLASSLRDIEQACGRDRSQPGDSRTMDIDLLLFDDLVSDDPALRLPRNDIERYAFVLRPLADIAADRLHPVNGLSFARMWAEFSGKRDDLRLADLPLASADG